MHLISVFIQGQINEYTILLKLLQFVILIMYWHNYNYPYLYNTQIQSRPRNSAIKMPNSQISAKQQAQYIATDMRLLHQISTGASLTNNSLQIPIPINRLTRLLQHKNMKYNYSNQQRQRDQLWIRNKKIDVKAMVKKADKFKDFIKNKQEELKKQNNSYFYVSTTDLQNTNQYVNKDFEYAIFSFARQTLSSKFYHNPRTHRANRKQKQLRVTPYVAPWSVDKIALTQRGTSSDQKIQQYLKSMTQLFAIQSPLQQKQWAAAFKSATKLKLWQILYNILPKINQKQYKIEQNSEYALCRMALQSLKLVQADFNSTLPSNYDSILYHLTANYLRKMPQKYQNSSTLGPIWGIAFLLYRAGRKNQFYQYLPDADLRNMFIRVDQSIMVGRPDKILINQEKKDAFQDQLIYALSGISKYASGSLCDPNTLDIVWIFLRNVGIFPDSIPKLLQLQQSLYQSYSNPSLQQCMNLLYLLSFNQLIDLGPNQLMDTTDYLHFLILLYHHPILKAICSNRRHILENALSDRLTQFVQLLMEAGKKQAIYYIVLMPVQCLAAEISSILAKKENISKTKWQDLQKYIPASTFNDLVEQTCSKHAQISNDYVESAQMAKNLTKKLEPSINFLLTLFGKSMLSTAFQENELNRAESLYKLIFKQDEKLKLQYGSLFDFFKEYRELKKLVGDRKQDKIYEFLKKCKFILLSEQVRLDVSTVLQQLISRNFFECYMIYMKEIVKAYEISLTKMGRFLDLQQIQCLTLSGLVGFVNSVSYSQFSKNQSVLSLMKQLQEALYRYR